MYTGPVEPGSTHDPTAAGLHVLPALHRSAWLGMPVLADKGYQGAGIGILVPTKNPAPTPDEQTRNNPLSALRAPAERANAITHCRLLCRSRALSAFDRFPCRFSSPPTCVEFWVSSQHPE